jgi:hypothetical protein
VDIEAFWWIVIIFYVQHLWVNVFIVKITVYQERYPNAMAAE